MSDNFRSALNPDPQPLLLPLLGSVMAHVGIVMIAGCAGLLMSFIRPTHPPMIDENQTIEVSMMVLPKSTTRMSERAQHAPVVTGQVETAPVETPIRQSDLSFKDPKAQQTKGQTDKLADARAEQMRKLQMTDALSDLDTPEGAVDRQASDPNSDSAEGYSADGRGTPTDPELARYVAKLQTLFRQNFHPLPAVVQANPDLVTKIHITVDPATWKVTGFEVVKKSGNESFDKAAELAVQSVAQIPPPPEKYTALAGTQGYTISFPATQ